MARLSNVRISGGVHASYPVELRKPLIFVGSAQPPGGSATTTVQIIDPISAVDLSKAAVNPPSVAGGMTAGAITWDGQYLLAAQGSQLAFWDTGTGTNLTATTALPFTPVRMAAAPRGQVMVALDSGNGSDSNVAIFQTAKLISSPSTATPTIVPFRGTTVRAVGFPADGTSIYVLTGGGSIDPCSSTTTSSSSIVVLDLNGQILATLALPNFMSDFTVDPASGRLILADSGAHQISYIVPAQRSGPVTPTKLLGGLTCPSAVRVNNGIAFVVTADRAANSDAFLMQRLNLKTNQPLSPISFLSPQALIGLVGTPSPDGNIGTPNLAIRPVSIWAYDVTITPDGSRAEFVTSAHYLEQSAPFTLGLLECQANMDITEFGLYSLDLNTGNSSYEMHSQLVQSRPPQNCNLSCSVNGIPQQPILCQSSPGDMPTLAAAFAQ
jgi:hypothetical protein